MNDTGNKDQSSFSSGKLSNNDSWLVDPLRAKLGVKEYEQRMAESRARFLESGLDYTPVYDYRGYDQEFINGITVLSGVTNADIQSFISGDE